MKTEFIPIDYDYFDWQGKNYIKIIGRNLQGKRICIIDTCDVYFWAILKNEIKEKQIQKIIKKIQKIELDEKGRKTKVEKIEIKEKKFLDKKVKALKIYATNYKDLHQIASHLGMKEIEKRRGYDLGFITHYINEKQISPLQLFEIQGEMLNNSQEFGGIDMALDVDFCIKLQSSKTLEKKSQFSPKTLAYDIETDAFNIGEGKIVMLSLAGSNGFKKVLTWKKLEKNSKQEFVEYVKDEAELLEKFCEEVKKFSPDFLVGYFSDEFDLPYLRTRANKLNVKLSLGLDGSQPKFSRGGFSTTGKINGIVHIDILKFIRTAYAQYMQSESLALNEVAKEFLGETKTDFKLKHSSKLQEEELKIYYEYNLQDSKLTLKLFEKFWPDILEFAKIIQEPVFDLSRAGLSKYLESYILHNLKKFNEIPEKRPTHEEIGERKKQGPVEGAFVFEPLPGIYEDIVMFDFTSMHTSIIISMNLSKSTLLGKKQKNSIESPEVELQGKKQKFYFSKEKGFFPSLLNEIFEKRKWAKSEYKKNPNPITKARSNAFKVLSASAHGYVAFFGSRYYSKETSASILGFVRKFNQDTIKKVQDKGFKVIFGDTDSVGFQKNKASKKEIKDFLEKLNSELPGIMHLELEGFFKRGIWVTTRAGTTGAKKKYAMIDEQGNLKIRGFETVRRDWCQLARKTQNKVIKLILENGDEKKALEFIKEQTKKLKNREVPREDLIIKTQLKKPLSEYKAITPHVVAAKRMKELEIPISQGGLIEYYLSETNTKSKLIRDKVRLPEENAKYDIEYYLNNQLLPAIENILQIFSINTKEIIQGKKQTCLSDF